MHEEIGIGHFGRIVRAYNKQEERMVALKVLPKVNIARMKQSDHVINEREVLAQLSKPEVDSCPFIMKFYSSFQDESNLYLELEYIKGCTLLSQVVE